MSNMVRRYLVLSVVLVLLLACTFGSVVQAEGTDENVCIHLTTQKLIETNEGYTIANVCTLCGDTSSVVGYVKNVKDITFYKDESKTTAYSDNELKTGFKSTGEKYLYVDNNVISKTGVPYWFTFDLKVNSLPNIDVGSSQADLTNVGTRAYKGWSVICMTIGGNYIAPLRLIPDGWEADSGASGTKKGAADGVSPIKYYGSTYREEETIVDVKAGDSLSFALHVDPTSGQYDVYVDKIYVGSGKMITSSDGSDTHIRLWEDSGNDYGGSLDFTEIAIFEESFAAVEHVHDYRYTIDFDDESFTVYNTCNCGDRLLVPNENNIASVVADGLPHIYDGLGSFSVDANYYWFVTDINVRHEVGDGALLTFGSETILEIRNGRLFHKSTALAPVTYPTTYQVALKIISGSYELYFNGKLTANGTLADTSDIICGDENFGYHVRFLYNKAVMLDETGEGVVPKYKVDESVPLCYHSDDKTDVDDRLLVHTKNGVKYIYQCSVCGERVYSMLNKDLTNPANDTEYQYNPKALMRSELKSFSTDTPRYLYLEDNVISNTAAPYWLTFDVTPNEIPSNATGNLDDPNSRVYRGYGLVSTEAAFIPLTELRVIPDGWEEGNAEKTIKGVADGRAEVKLIKISDAYHIGMDTINYRFTETVAYLEVGKTTSFALRIDPKTGVYDVYVDGIYKASSKKATYSDINPKIIFHDNGMGNFTYSNVSVCEESLDFENKVVAIDLEAKFDLYKDSFGSSYTALASIERGEYKYSFFYVNNKSGSLAFRDKNGEFVALYDFYGNVVTLDDAKKISVVYDDINNDVRYYVDGELAKYNNGERLTFAEGIKVYDSEFSNASGNKDSLCFNPANVKVIGVSGLCAADTAEVVGFQSRDDNSNIRVISGVDSLYYMSVGYDIRAYKADGTPYSDKKTTISSNAVYSSVIAANEVVPATKFGYKYFSTLVIDGDFTEYEGSYVIIKPFTTVGGRTYYGKEVKITILGDGKHEIDKGN